MFFRLYESKERGNLLVITDTLKYHIERLSTKRAWVGMWVSADGHESEVGIGEELPAAVAKAMLGSGCHRLPYGRISLTHTDAKNRKRQEGLESVRCPVLQKKCFTKEQLQLTLKK